MPGIPKTNENIIYYKYFYFLCLSFNNSWSSGYLALNYEA